MSREQFVSATSDGHVGIVTLDRASALNAISGAMARELGATFDRLTRDSGIWVVVVRAAGERAFCVGADLKERASFSLGDFYDNRRDVRALFAAIRQVPQPTIAATFGFALGGGFELALSCDLIVAAADSTFGLPEVTVGLLPAGGGTQLLPRKIGAARAKELIFTGRRVSAHEAHEMGFVARVVSRDELDEASMDLARDICSSSPVAVREAKRAADAALGSIEAAIELEDEAWGNVITSDDRAEGIAAFNEKRTPRWRNR